jgi:hypothetical protein
VLPLPEKVLANPDTIIAGLMAFFGNGASNLKRPDKC